MCVIMTFITTLAEYDVVDGRHGMDEGNNNLEYINIKIFKHIYYGFYLDYQQLLFINRP